MERAVNSGQSFNLERYTFERDGTVKKSHFKVWQVQQVGNETKFEDLYN
jgi:hypothetical protein